MKTEIKLKSIPKITLPEGKRESISTDSKKKVYARPDLTKEQHKDKLDEERKKLAKKSKLPSDIFVAKSKQKAKEKQMNKARHF